MTTYPVRAHRVTTTYSENGEATVERESYAFMTPHGAIEGWRMSAPLGGFNDSGYYGGIEIHAKKPFAGWHEEPISEHCEWAGGPCWTDGSSVAYYDIQDLFDKPTEMFAHLERWADEEWKEETR